MSDMRRVDVLDATMAHRELAEPSLPADALTAVFLHGNPTSSFLWRNVMPHVADLARCVAPDLIGMGDSSKRPGTGDDRYRFVEHARHLDAWFDAVVPDGPVVLVLHDWGSALGFHWARRHPERIVGIAHTEAIVAQRSWDDWSESGRRIFEGLRSEAGEEMVLDANIFIERLLTEGNPAFLDDEAMAAYRAPFTGDREDRRPMLTWAREIPLDGDPADVAAVVDGYASWLATSDVAKLLVVADRGNTLVGRHLEVARSFPNQTEVTVEAAHFVPEHSPHELGEHLRDWMIEKVLS